MSRLTKQQAAQVQQVKDRLLDPRRVAARAYVQQEAEQAGLDEDTVAACVDAAMSAWGDDVVCPGQEEWEDLWWRRSSKATPHRRHSTSHAGDNDMTKFGELNTGDMFRYVSNGNGAGATFRKASPRDAVQQREDGTGDIQSVDALVKTRRTTQVERVPLRTHSTGGTKCQPIIRFESFTSGNFKPTVTGFVEDVRATETNYSHVVSASEWEVVVTYTGRQDGRMAWMAALVQVDGDVAVLKGLDKYAEAADKINAAIFQLTFVARWIEPLNAFMKG